MKKLLVVISAFVLIIGLTACGTSSGITYSKEFSYLPAYNNTMKADNTTPPNKLGLSTAYYTLKNATDTEVFATYESLLKKDGWSITKEQKPYNIMATKGNHQATVVIMQANKNIKLIIMAK